ncbi:MAG: hypothetical protein WCK81_12375 [Betaproteobacteria bacterium]
MKYRGPSAFSSLACWTQCIAVAVCFIFGCAHAAEIKIDRGSKGDSDTIKIQGEIKTGDEDKFRALAMGSRKATVLLDSKGGRLGPALEIGKMIRLRGFATAVQDATCQSACSLIWLAGEPRYMNNFTSIGFHTAFRTGKNGELTSTPTHGAIIGAYLTRLGFSDKVVLFVVSASAHEMHWLQKSTADRLGIAVNVRSSLGPDTAMSDFEQALRARAAAPPDDARAALLYAKSAVAGYAGAQNNLGDLYESGHGVPKNDKMAVYWYTRAAERGEPTAYLSLASFLAEGTANPEALVEAAKYAGLAFTFLPEGRNKEQAGRLTESLGKKLGQADKKRVVDLINQWAPLYQEEHLMGDTPKK